MKTTINLTIHAASKRVAVEVKQGKTKLKFEGWKEQRKNGTTD